MARSLVNFAHTCKAVPGEPRGLGDTPEGFIMAARFCIPLAFVLALSIGAPVPLSGAQNNFVLGWTFKGPALTDWRPLGQADWCVENGEIVATPRSTEGGWLLLNQGFQDVQMAASVRCADAASCRPGLLLRAEKTPEGPPVADAETRRRTRQGPRRLATW